MPVFSRWSLLAVLSVALSFATPRRAAAQPPRAQSIHILAIDSDDADEQAEALTTALRGRIRETPGWTLLETSQSLSMLTAAFQCPQRPDAACLLRIGDKLKSDQYFWGVMTKAPGHQVTAEVHLWSRGKPDQVARESYSDNLKDANDDSLKKVAALIFGKLLGITNGTLVVHASADAGSILIDGVPKATLDHSHATVLLPAGPHSVEIQAPGFANARRDVNIAPGGNVNLEVVLEADAAVATPTGPSSPLPVRAIVGWSAVAAGGILVATGIGFGASYLSDESDLNNARQNNYLTGSTTPVSDPCNPSATTPSTIRGCNAVNDAHKAEIGEITTFSLGAVLAGVGIYLIVTDRPTKTDAPAAPKAALSGVHLLPSVGPGSGSMLLLGEF